MAPSTGQPFRWQLKPLGQKQGPSNKSSDTSSGKRHTSQQKSTHSSGNLTHPPGNCCTKAGVIGSDPNKTEGRNKFGSFMGNMLLVRKPSTASPETKKPSHQATLTQATVKDSYRNYFRLNKPGQEERPSKLTFKLGSQVSSSSTAPCVIGIAVDHDSTVSNEPSTEQQDAKDDDMSISSEDNNESHALQHGMMKPENTLQLESKDPQDSKETTDPPCVTVTTDPQGITETVDSQGSIETTDRQYTADTTNMQIKENDTTDTTLDGSNDCDDMYDLSSLSSLQSDDDVLGPWVALESNDEPTITEDHKTEPSNDSQSVVVEDQAWCEACDQLRSKESSPLEMLVNRQCGTCQTSWKDYTSQFLSRIYNKIKQTGKRGQRRSPSQSSRSVTKSKAAKTASSTRNRKAVPPTKSRLSKKPTAATSVAETQTAAKTARVTVATKESDSSDQAFYTTGAFLTRNTVKQLADPEFGFHPNPYGFCHGQKVEVLNINGHWYRAVLMEMRAGKVKVTYSDWKDQEEWIIMGSRRLRVLTQEEEGDDGGDDQEQEQKNDLPLLKRPERDRNKDDYVSATLDLDPTQIFNDNQVFMTRRMAKELTDAHGFRANAFGYRYNRPVAVTFQSQKSTTKTSEYLGYLREMKPDQVRVWYPTLQQSEWFKIGSRRLRMLTREEEEAIADVPPSYQAPADDQEEQTEKQGVKNDVGAEDTEPSQPPSTTATVSKRGKERPPKTSPPRQRSSTPKQDTPKKEDPSATQSNFLTTGAFATRRAMRQLKDEHGFVPNPYGYAYDLLVEVLNTRTAKTKFWERGRLVAMRPGEVQVHYEGWSDVYDEWIKVGSRRIRIVSEAESVANNEPLAEKNTDSQPTTDTTDLLMTERNPELKNAKRVTKRCLLGPEDYARLGYLVTLEELVKPSKPRARPSQKRKSVAMDADLSPASSEDDQVHDSDKEYGTSHRQRSRPRRKKRQQPKKKAARTQKKANSTTPTPSSSLLTTLVAASTHNSRSNYDFGANEYGYDYMQHVQVLHTDKKFYEARLVSMDKHRVKVHYCGWIDKFDEYIPLGSRRLHVIENDQDVLCAEPGYRERYEQMQEEDMEKAENEVTQQNRRRRRRRALSTDPGDLSDEDKQVEYHKDITEDMDVEEMDTWKVYCNQCSIVIKQFRYYCTYCETPSEGHDYKSFELCLQCFDQNFPFWHEHPRSSFAVQAVIDAEVGPRPIKGELVTVWEEDVMGEHGVATSDPANKDEVGVGSDQETGPTEASQVFSGTAPIDADQGYKYLKLWQRRKVCAFCNDDDDTSEELGAFIGPFVIATFNKNGVEKKRQFWAHDSCARYSPEVFCTPEGKWYNVTLALRRGRGMRCYACKEKGATIGCFDSRCTKSFHLPCAQKPVSYFKNGVIFWCPTHEAYYNKKDTYVNIFHCDGCNKEFKEESWFSCLECASGYFSSYDLCLECFERPKDHQHDDESFEETSFAIIKEMEAEKAREIARAKENAASKRKKSLFPRQRRRRLPDGSYAATCCYCGTQDAEEWRRGYGGGVIMCRKCFELALLVDNDGQDKPLILDDEDQDKYVASIEDYTHKPYLTRDALSATKFSETINGQRLATYEPQPHQLFSLVFDSTYFDIPGRAPRWATHSGTDYHGTWLPQTVRRAILQYTEKDERVLSNFLGRGTDAIECFLLQRKCCGVDINPAAVALSQRNCCFEIPPGLTSAEYRPVVAQADARHLVGSLFADESFHHILSHPPYKDCVAYSTHLEGDLSRFTNIDDFKREYVQVVSESWRLLKMGRRLTLGIGDNREHCFYVPVGFHLFRQYIDQGFELEELIIKRQRYCSAFGLGTYLCVQFDFLVFTHEFIATFRKIPHDNIDRMVSMDYPQSDNHVCVTRMTRGIPSSAIARKSVVMGTVWVFKPTGPIAFEQQCVSRMVERFGRDECNWQQVQLDFMDGQQQQHQQQPVEQSTTSTTDVSPTDEPCSSDADSDKVSDYEQQRLKRIEENTKTLLKLGLISELSEDSDDIAHYECMMSKPSIPDAPLFLVVVGHWEKLQEHQIGQYRQSLCQIALEASRTLAPYGMLILGTKDVRSEQGKLWPMSMLVFEDVERTVDRNRLKLKELIVAVPDGYSKDRNGTKNYRQESEDDEINVVDDHLPIVHAIYLVFQKLP